MLSKLCNGTDKQLPLHIIKALLAEIMLVVGENNSVDFTFPNSKPGRVILVPQTSTMDTFLRYAKKKWIDKILEHIAGKSGSLGDAAEWLSVYLGKCYESNFLIAANTLGMPLVTRMDEITAAAMWTDANVSLAQQRILSKYIRHTFENSVIIPEATQQAIVGDVTTAAILPIFGEYSFFKDGQKNQNDNGREVPLIQEPEICPYWYRNVDLALVYEVERMLQANIPMEAYTATTTGIGWDILIGADHGKGAWHSWLKFFVQGPEKLREISELTKWQQNIN